MRSKFQMLGIIALLAFILVACAAPTPTAVPATAVPAPTKAPAAAEPTKAPAATTAPAATKAPEATKPPAPTTVPTPAAPAPKRGGKVTMAVWQSPITLNTLLGTQTVMDEVLVFLQEGLSKVEPDGKRVPALAKEIPTVQNGGVSADGKTVTWKLKEGLVYSDGKPVTCADFQFTLQAWMTPGVGVVSTTGYQDVDKVDCPDPNTIVIRFKNFYAPYLTLFGNDLLPKHATGDPKDMTKWEFNRKPIGTGPFKLDEWVADSHIVLSRNPNYREKDKPYLDQVVIRIVPSSEVAMQLLSSGEVDIMWNNTEADFPLLEKMTGVKISDPLQIGGERLFLNMAENKDPSDPKKPHPILSDVKVRQAIEYGINKQRIIDKLLFGKAKPGTNEINAGFFQCADFKPRGYDVAQAKKLLDEAGWVPGSDGIRVAKGSKTAPDGTRLRLKYSTTSGNKLREDSQVLVVEDMKAIGVELYIENAPSSVVIGSWDGGSPRRHGNFDIIMYTTNASIDPHGQMLNLFYSKNIPSETNKGGVNYTRFNDPQVDSLLDKAGAEPDINKRRDLYCQVAKIGQETTNMIYLYQRLDMDSYRDRLLGWVPNAWDNNGWNADLWSLK
ncbi:MAG: peptide ABC transporter substrate-binding protein [Chloroflexi bacterium]|nr:peptide ABC transporter substrate-binding protein [Chloroflexota bacterium]